MWLNKRATSVFPTQLWCEVKQSTHSDAYEVSDKNRKYCQTLTCLQVPVSHAQPINKFIMMKTPAPPQGRNQALDSFSEANQQRVVIDGKREPCNSVAKPSTLSAECSIIMRHHTGE